MDKNKTDPKKASFLGTLAKDFFFGCMALVPLAVLALSFYYIVRFAKNLGGALFGLVMRGTEVMTPRPALRLEPGDLVTILALTPDVTEVERLLQVGIDYF